MEQYISKSDLIEEIKRLDEYYHLSKGVGGEAFIESLLSLLDTLEVKDPYEQCIQYDSIKAGIQAHAETYSFNIESELFNQLTKEQQELWRKEIERACISGGGAGVELARDPRYKENLEVKEVDSTPNIRFPHYKSIVEKVFGAGNLESFEYDEAEQLVSLAKEELLKDLEVKEVNLELENDNPKITAGTKIRSKENPDIILRIISDDCHGDEFECSNGSVLSLKQIEKYYDII